MRTLCRRSIRSKDVCLKTTGRRLPRILLRPFRRRLPTEANDDGGHTPKGDRTNDDAGTALKENEFFHRFFTEDSADTASDVGTLGSHCKRERCVPSATLLCNRKKKIGVMLRRLRGHRSFRIGKFFHRPF